MEGGGKLLVIVSILAVALTLHTTNCKPSGHSMTSTTNVVKRGTRDGETASVEVLGKVGSFVASQVVRFLLDRLTQSDTPRSQQEQPEDETIEELLREALGDETLNELERLLDSATSSPSTAKSQTQLIEQQQEEEEDENLDRELEQLLNLITTEAPSTAKTQSSKPHKGEKAARAEFFSSNTWTIALECLNDIFGSDNDGDTPPGAAIEEVKKVMVGEMALSEARAEVQLNWPIVTSCVDRFINSYNPNGGGGGGTTTASNQFLSNFFSSFFGDEECLVSLVVVATTADSQNSHTTTPPTLEITLITGETRSVQLPITERQEFQRNGGDDWEFAFTEFSFSEDCVELEDIVGVALVEGGTDGWRIQTILTLVEDDDGVQSLLTSNIQLDKWIDANSGAERRRIELTLAPGNKK